MSAASDYLENALIKAVFKGQAYPSPTNTYIALHTANPTDAGLNEVSVTTWPSYMRAQAENGTGTGNGWVEPVNGETKNTHQIAMASYDGTAPLTLSHWSVWDAPYGGNMLVHAPLGVQRTIQPGAVTVFDINTLIIQLS